MDDDGIIQLYWDRNEQAICSYSFTCAVNTAFSATQKTQFEDSLMAIPHPALNVPKPGIGIACSIYYIW